MRILLLYLPAFKHFRSATAEVIIPKVAARLGPEVSCQEIPYDFEHCLSEAKKAIEESSAELVILFSDDPNYMSLVFHRYIRNEHDPKWPDNEGYGLNRTVIIDDGPRLIITKFPSLQISNQWMDDHQEGQTSCTMKTGTEGRLEDYISFHLESEWPEKGVTVGLIGLPEIVDHHEFLQEEALIFAVKKLLRMATESLS